MSNVYKYNMAFASKNRLILILLKEGAYIV